MSLPLSAVNSDNLDQLFAEEKYHTVLEMIFPNAQAGDVEAQLLLAKMYFEGKGLEKDFNKATYWICRASEADNFKANKFRIKMSLSMISEEYQPPQCSSALDILKK
jgi:TPR repeat protein